MQPKDRIDSTGSAIRSGKRPWVQPLIEAAPARQADAFFGPPGGVDYGFYS